MRMKKIYISILGIIAFSNSVFAQASALVTNLENGQTVIDGGIVYHGVATDASSQIDFNIKNTSAVTKVYKLERTDQTLNTGSIAYFCFSGTCYPPNIIVSPVTLTLTAGQDASSISLPMQLHLDEGSSMGNSRIRYKLYDANNVTDIITFYIEYNNPLSVKSIFNKAIAVSSVFPSPAVNKASITIQSPGEVANVSVQIMNSLGAVCYAKMIDLILGSNTVSADCSNLNSGVYFMNISYNNKNITKKFIINNN
jgi:hypothetical protein